jgi:hypothetical protein
MAKEMADRQAIADVFSEYAWALDAADWDLLRQVFHEDASLTLELTGADTVGPIAPGAAVVDFISSTSEGQDDQRRHVVTNLRYESEGEEDAVVTATLTLLVTADGELSVQSGSSPGRGRSPRESGSSPHVPISRLRSCRGELFYT